MTETGYKVRGSQIYLESINANRMRPSANFAEIAFPIVTKDQSVTSSTLTTLTGRYKFKPDNWDFNFIEKIEVELEFTSEGAGEITLYDDTNSAQLQSLVSVSAATSYTCERYDVTDKIKALTSNTKLAIQAKGDGSNATTVYKATLIVTVKL